jgi:hypothetical protein
LNRLLNALIITRNFKERVKSIYYQIQEGQPDFMETVRSARSQHSNWTSSLDDGWQEEMEEEVKEDEIDSSQGIMHLARLLSSEEL